LKFKSLQLVARIHGEHFDVENESRIGRNNATETLGTCHIKFIQPLVKEECSRGKAPYANAGGMVNLRFSSMHMP